MKPATLFAPSVYRAVIFLFILLVLFNRAYSQLTDADQVKKVARGTLIKLKTAQTALAALEIEDLAVTEKFKKAYNDSLVWEEKKSTHNLQKKVWIIKEGDPDPPEFIDYNKEAYQLITSFKEITERRAALKMQLEKIQAGKESLKFEIIKLRSLLKHKSIDVLKFFNSANCGQMPGEVATVAEWKSYLDCLFDGTPRNHVDFKDPDKSGDIKVSPNTDPNIIIPDNNPLEREKKLKEIKRMIDESNNNKKPNQPVVVAPPTGDNTNEKGGSLTDALKSLIYQLKNKIK